MILWCFKNNENAKAFYVSLGRKELQKKLLK